jgi:hypothetical protein
VPWLQRMYYSVSPPTPQYFRRRNSELCLAYYFSSTSPWPASRAGPCLRASSSAAPHSVLPGALPGGGSACAVHDASPPPSITCIYSACDGKLRLGLGLRSRGAHGLKSHRASGLKKNTKPLSGFFKKNRASFSKPPSH